jgi:hypothetical protein
VSPGVQTELFGTSTANPLVQKYEETAKFIGTKFTSTKVLQNQQKGRFKKINN